MPTPRQVIRQALEDEDTSMSLLHTQRLVKLAELLMDVERFLLDAVTTGNDHRSMSGLKRAAQQILARYNEGVE